MDKQTRRNFLKKAGLISGGVGLLNTLPTSIQKAFAINPAKGSTFEDAEHVVLLMQENRSFDHCFGSLNGVRGFNDPRAIQLPNGDPVWMQANKDGQSFLPFRLNMQASKITWMGGLPHTWTDQVDARNAGKYDNWLNAKKTGYPGFRDQPMTLGHYTREDLPFNYAMADAFTICDHHFCSSLTGTTPNRLYFFSGCLRHGGKADQPALVQNEYVDYDREINWKTVPEMLQDAGISWKIYQNELSYPAGLKGDDEPWLSNFTDNPIEWFSQFHIRRQKRYVGILETMIRENEQHIVELQKKSENNNEDRKITKELNTANKYKVWLDKELKKIKTELETPLDPNSEALCSNAFVVNEKDVDFHKTEKVKYKDAGQEREIVVPKSDIFYQFRKDVLEGKLPSVSWLVAPENFSDHPAAPWYGSWYVSEALDILTQNPEIWKKTIFILTYDENDGYFDHLPPFVAPDYRDEKTGKVSSAIKNIASEFVTKEDEIDRKKVSPSRVRESPIGLGYRVPFIVASPWTRGGYVNSQIFDHTSVVQFLENFATRKSGKKARCENLTDWRRTVCGDLSSVFRPYHGEKINEPTYLKRNEYVQRIDKARFQPLPKLTEALSESVKQNLRADAKKSKQFFRQEHGTRKANSLYYDLQVDLKCFNNKLELFLGANGQLFGHKSLGAPFTVYSLNDYKKSDVFEKGANWNFTVVAGDQLSYDFPMDKFLNHQYHLAIHGPNGFYRMFKGDAQSTNLEIIARNAKSKLKKFGFLTLQLKNKSEKSITLSIVDNAYGKSTLHKTIHSKSTIELDISLESSFGWYDFSVLIDGDNNYKTVYAGHVENSSEYVTDPQMG